MKGDVNERGCVSGRGVAVEVDYVLQLYIKPSTFHKIVCCDVLTVLTWLAFILNKDVLYKGGPGVAWPEMAVSKLTCAHVFEHAVLKSGY